VPNQQGADRGPLMDDTSRPAASERGLAPNDRRWLPTMPDARARTWMTRKIVRRRRSRSSPLNLGCVPTGAYLAKFTGRHEALGRSVQLGQTRLAEARVAVGEVG
jgi:hypothetical protein